MELRRYLEVLWRRKRLFLLIAGGIVILTLLWALYATRVYKATTKVLIKIQDTTSSVSSLVPSALGKLEYTVSGNVAGTVKEMIGNKDSLNRVIDELKLLKKNGKPFSSIELLDSSLLNIFIHKTGIKIAQISDSDIIEIMGYSEDPALAVKISNAFTSHSLEMLEKLNREAIGKTIDILTKEASRLKYLVADSEETIKKYKIRNEAINIDEKASTYTGQLLNTELSIAKLSTEKKEDHPDLVAALAQIAHIKNELKDITAKQFELAKLQRINISMGTVYTALLNDLEKAKILKAMSITNMQVVEMAQIPDASKKYYIYFPKRKIMLFLAMIIGGFLGVIAVFFAEYIDDTIKSPKELKAWTGQKVLTVIKLLKDTEIFPPKESSPIFNSISDLWLSIKIDAKNLGNKKCPRILTVTSYGEKEGKSLVAVNLALLLSKNRHKTLIIDFNLTDSFLSKLYSQPPEKGLADFVVAEREKKTDNFPIFKKLDDNLYFLPTGLTGEHNIALIKNSLYLSDLIEIAKNEFDMIVVDSSPLNKSREPFFIAKESDATILVVEAGRYRLENIIWAIDELKEAGIFIAGSVLNKLDS